MTTKVAATPKEIVQKLAPAYKEWKGGEKAKNKLKEEFFEAITEQVKGEELGEQIVLVEEADSVEGGQEWVEKHHPFFEVTDHRENPDGPGYEYIITERPEYKSFYVDYDGYTYGRQVAVGPTLIDEDEILNDNPELWQEITDYENGNLIRDLMDWSMGEDAANIDTEQFVAKYCDQRGIKRVLKPIEDLSPDQLASLQFYSYPGKPVVKLPSPKKVKE